MLSILHFLYCVSPLYPATSVISKAWGFMNWTLNLSVREQRYYVTCSVFSVHGLLFLHLAFQRFQELSHLFRLFINELVMLYNIGHGAGTLGFRSNVFSFSLFLHVCTCQMELHVLILSLLIAITSWIKRDG